MDSITLSSLTVIITGGLLAGIITGLVGGSAALVVTPFMTGFLGADAFWAIGVALATDVFASAASTITYARQGFVKFRRSFLMVIFAAIGSILGTFISTLVDNSALSSAATFLTLIMGLKFFLSANKEDIKEKVEPKDPKTEQTINILVGLFLVTFFVFI